MSGLTKVIGVAFAAVMPALAPMALGATTVAGSVFTAGAAAGGGSVLSGLVGGMAKQAIVGGLMSVAGGGSFKDGVKSGIATGLVSNLFGAPQTGQPGAEVAGGIARPEVAGGSVGSTGSASPSGGFGSPTSGLGQGFAGEILKGAAAGWAQGAAMKEREKQEIRAEDRAAERYDGAGEAMRFGMPTAQADPTEEPMPTRFDKSPARPRYAYNREEGRIQIA